MKNSRKTNISQLNPFSKKGVLLFTLLLFQISFGQVGCTDVNALNYNSSASVNDGSCLYPMTTLICPVVGNIPSQVYESSGLILIGDKLWSHNDSDNSPKLYGFDTTNFQIQDTFVISNAINTDWEDLARSETHLFIGDFGNNSATRTDLKVLRIALNDINGSDTSAVESILFSYPDQTSFTPSSSHGFDCEAFFFLNDTLHLFTKHWGNGYTKHYKVPNEIGSHVALFVDSLLVDGQVTAADISSSGIISLLGYAPPAYAPFMYLLWDYPSENFYNGNKRRLDMGNVLTMGQQEGVVFSSSNSGYISSKRVSSPIVIESRFFKFDLDPIFNPVSSIANLEAFSETIIYPNPFSNKLTLEIDGKYEFSFMNIQGEVIIQGESEGTNTISTDNLNKGIYIIRIEQNSESIFVKVIKN